LLHDRWRDLANFAEAARPHEDQPMKRHDISKRHDIAIAFVLAITAGCSAGEVQRQVENQGKLCAFPPGTAPMHPELIDPAPLEYPANQDIAVAVTFPLCMSSSCTSERMASCTVQQTGNTLRVTASGSFLEKTEGACTTDCGRLTAKCTIPALPAGTYTIDYAGRTTDLVLPSSVSPPCVGSLSQP
jgi:hypothetical protein